MAQQGSCRNRLLRAMPAADFALLALEPIDLPTRFELIRPGVAIETLYFLERGLASITTASTAGSIEVGVVGSEGLVGATPLLLDVEHSPHPCFMQMPGDGFRVTAANLLGAVEHSATLRRLLLRYVQAHIVQVAQTAFANAVHTIEVRLARWLLMCRDRAEGDDMAVTHEYLAAMLGVRRPGVTVATQMLEGNHLVRASRGHIVVLDRPGLEALAGDSYGLPETEYAALIEGVERLALPATL